MRATHILVLATATVALAASTSASQASNEPQITSITYSGTGCPPNSVGVLVATAGNTAALVFDSFLLNGSKSATTNSNTSCEVRFTMLNGVGSRGRAGLAPDNDITQFQVDIRGFAAGGRTRSGLSETVQARVSSSALAAPLTPPAVFRLADGTAGGNDYTISSRAKIKFPTGGRPIMVSLHTELLMVAKEAQAGGILTVDSINVALNPS